MRGRYGDSFEPLANNPAGPPEWARTDWSAMFRAPMMSLRNCVPDDRPIQIVRTGKPVRPIPDKANLPRTWETEGPVHLCRDILRKPHLSEPRSLRPRWAAQRGADCRPYRASEHSVNDPVMAGRARKMNGIRTRQKVNAWVFTKVSGSDPCGQLIRCPGTSSRRAANWQIVDLMIVASPGAEVDLIIIPNQSNSDALEIL
jgi:hypothetical protein